jgi:cytidylate kinase
MRRGASQVQKERSAADVWRGEPVHGTAEDARDDEQTQDADAARGHPGNNSGSDMAQRKLIIAIDGPSGAGKGTVARAVAHALSYTHVDTGAMYRAVAWLAGHLGVDLQDEAAVARLAAEAVLEVDTRVSVNGHDVTIAIRTPEMDSAAAVVARHPRVRAALVERQRAYGRDAGVVMEGRDIGTAVFPSADVKFYLDATPEERARRRANDSAHAMSRDGRGMASVAGDLAARDSSDRTRVASPLTKADDAIYVDTTGVPVDDVVAQVLEIVRTRIDR